VFHTYKLKINYIFCLFLVQILIIQSQLEIASPMLTFGVGKYLYVFSRNLILIKTNLSTSKSSSLDLVSLSISIVNYFLVGFVILENFIF